MSPQKFYILSTMVLFPFCIFASSGHVELNPYRDSIKISDQVKIEEIQIISVKIKDVMTKFSFDQKTCANVGEYWQTHSNGCHQEESNQQDSALIVSVEIRSTSIDSKQTPKVVQFILPVTSVSEDQLEAIQNTSQGFDWFGKKLKLNAEIANSLFLLKLKSEESELVSIVNSSLDKPQYKRVKFLKAFLTVSVR
ncbi:MAG: hypothetical protein ACK5P5_04140 [Pseudobdellovibrionaceae bacterium]